MNANDLPNRELIDVFIARRNELRSIAARIVGYGDQADDVLQDGFIKLMECAAARDIANPFGYCCQVVRNLSLDHCRRRVVEAGCIMPTAEGELPEVEGSAQADAGIDERRLLERIETVLAGLPERTCKVFELYRLEGRTQREIAHMLGVSATLVNFMIKDAMTALSSCRQSLEP